MRAAGRRAHTRRPGSLVSGGHWLRRRAARAVCAWLLLAIASWPAVADESSRLTTILLVARDKVSDPSFGGSVVLVMNHVADGPVGVIINRPTRMGVADCFRS